MEPKKRIAVFFYEDRSIDTYPYIINAVRLLSDRGYRADLFLNKKQNTKLNIKNCNIFITSDFNKYDYVLNTVNRVKEQEFNYDFLFAYSLEGLLISFLLNQEKNQIIPSAYFSMELIYKNMFFLNILQSFYYILKLDFKKFKLAVLKFLFIYRQKKMEKIVKFSVIMDKYRADRLKKEFSFANKIHLLPNSYIGISRESTDYAYEKFDIPREKKILLFTGGIEKYVFDKNLPSVAQNCGPGFVMLLSGFSRDNYVNIIKKKYNHLIKTGRLIINQQNLNEEEYDKLIRSCYIGLAWYKKTKIKNLYYMGLSSGKLTKYLSCKKPVIAPSYLFKYKELIDGNRIGKTCADTSEICRAITQISAEYDKLIENAENFYTEKIEFKKQFNPVIQELEKNL